MVSRLIRLLAVTAMFGALTFSQNSASPNLIITSPAANTLVHPGDTVRVKVDASRNYVAVYLVGDNPIGVSTQALRTAPSYTLSIQIPGSIKPGTYKITAMGALANGRPDTSVALPLDVAN
ncbi:MAG TPA: Ig-like domain-containing protein [Bryobacteraceae bacterium]|jgi:hypothetical protein|nr:Ig-like domain-containing protein [Bryobacteraceae bacterium]